MHESGIRRSSRIKEDIPITLIGSDTEGKVFLEHTHTTLVSLYGAGVVSQYKLSPEQEMLIRLQDCDKEAEVRVIGQIGVQSGSFVYGVAFLHPHLNFWAREFTQLIDSQTNRSTLECSRCQSRESIEHDDLEFDVYAFHETVVRYCKKCVSSTVWRVSSGQIKEEVISGEPEQKQEAPAKANPEVPIGVPAQRDALENKRKHRRTKLTFTACVRRPGFEDDVVICEDMSRGGVRFKSRKVYFVDTMIEIAVPYSPGPSNIFVPAQIFYVQELEKQRFFRCGVAYTKRS
jgi:PilZ domain